MQDAQFGRLYIGMQDAQFGRLYIGMQDAQFGRLLIFVMYKYTLTSLINEEGRDLL
jgi:hypothetical protein